MMSVNLINTAILNIKGFDYRSIINLIMDKSGTKNLMQNADFTKKSRTLQRIKNLFSYVKMGKDILMFGNIEIEKKKFYCQKTPVPLKDVDIEKALVSNKISFGEKNYKYFIGYL